MFVKTGDKVKVIAGSEKGKGVNMIKKATKASASNANGGVVETEGSIHASNVKVIAKAESNKD